MGPVVLSGVHTVCVSLKTQVWLPAPSPNPDPLSPHYYPSLKGPPGAALSSQPPSHRPTVLTISEYLMSFLSLEARNTDCGDSDPIDTILFILLFLFIILFKLYHNS